MRYDPKRREFAKKAGLLAFLGTSITAPLLVRGQQPRVRVSVDKFAQDAKSVASLRKAFDEMKKRPPSDPKGLSFQAAVHDVFSWVDYLAQFPADQRQAMRQQVEKENPDLVVFAQFLGVDDLDKVAAATRQRYWSKCDHWNPNEGLMSLTGHHFVSWHRLYLLYFENLLRELSGDDNLNLPYWDSVASPRLPAIFRAGTEKTNSLRLEFRDERANTGEIIESDNPAADFLYGGLRESQLLSSQGPKGPPVRGLSRMMELTPHNGVHGAIGGAMGSTISAARDPIFWLHHANIDRLWRIWQLEFARQQAKLPAKDRGDKSIYKGWLATSWEFPTAPNAERKPVSSIMDTVALGYQYDDEKLPDATAGVGIPELPKETQTATGKDVTGMRPEAITTRSSLAIGGTSFNVVLPVRSGQQGNIEALSKGAVSELRSATLVLEGVTFTAASARTGFLVDVYVNLPETSKRSEAKAGDYYVGTINRFSARCYRPKDCQPDRPLTLRFPLTEILRRQGQLASQALSTLRVSFIVRGYKDESGRPVPPASKEPLVLVRDFRVDGSAKPDR